VIARRLATASLAIVVAPAGAAAEPLRLRGDALATTAAPAGLLVLDASDRSRPWLDAEALVWLGASGGDGLGTGLDGDGAEADALVVAVTLRDPGRRGTLRLGRQVVVAGALRPVHVDGADGHARLPGRFDLQLFGGIPVVPELGPDAYDWVAGGRLARALGDARLGIGWAQERDAGALASHELAADMAWVPDRWPVDVAAGAAWSLAGDALAKVDASASWRRPRSRYELFTSHRSPAHLLPATSLFTVLGDVDVTRAGTTGRWRVAPRLDLEATAVVRFADSNPDPEASAEARLALDAAWRSTALVELRRQGERGDGWTGARGAVRLALDDTWSAAGELELVVPDDPRGRGALWPWALLALTCRPGPRWELAAGVEASASPADTWRIDGIARLSRAWELPR
jgi:hypothetical protein